jgi:hypothetical protein
MRIELWIMNFSLKLYFNRNHFSNSISLSKFAPYKVQKEIIVIIGGQEQEKYYYRWLAS